MGRFSTTECTYLPTYLLYWLCPLKQRPVIDASVFSSSLQQQGSPICTH